MAAPAPFVRCPVPRIGERLQRLKRRAVPPVVLIVAMDVAFLGAPASRRHAREARDEDAGETPPASERVKKFGDFHCDGRSAEEMA